MPKKKKAPPRKRVTAEEQSQRFEFVELFIAQGTSDSLTARLTAQNYGISLRQAQRYVKTVRQQLAARISSSELDCLKGTVHTQLNHLLRRCLANNNDELALKVLSKKVNLLAFIEKNRGGSHDEASKSQFDDTILENGLQKFLDGAGSGFSE